MNGLSPKNKMKINSKIKEAVEDDSIITIRNSDFEKYPRLYVLVGEAVVRGYGVVRLGDKVAIIPGDAGLVDGKGIKTWIFTTLVGFILSSLRTVSRVLGTVFGAIKGSGNE